MTTGFGPQGPNFSLVRPAADPKVSVTDTWAKPCSYRGADDGTYLTADFFNVMIANLRQAVFRSGVVLDDTNDLMLYEAIQAICDEEIGATVTASRGLHKVGSDIQMAVGAGILPVLT